MEIKSLFEYPKNEIVHINSGLLSNRYPKKLIADIIKKDNSSPSCAKRKIFNFFY